MKRLIFPVVFLVVLGGLAPSLRAEPPCCKGPQCPMNADVCYAKELLDILQTTHSVDAFVVTLNLLVDSEVEPRTAIPLIVRNAERLGVFADTLQQAEEDEDQPAYVVIELLGQLKERMRATRESGNAPKKCIQAEPIGPPKAEEQHHEDNRLNKSNFRNPILGCLIREDAPEVCEDRPDDAEVLRALPPCGAPYLSEASRSDVNIVSERVADKIDPPRFFPMIGLAQLHHCHWKCTVYYGEKLEGNSPFPYPLTELRGEVVVYLDKDHLHLYSPPQNPPSAPFDGGLAR